MLAIVSIPSLYIKTLISMEDAIAEAGAKKKKLNAIHNRGLNGMKQKIKKAQREHEDLITKYKAVSIALYSVRRQI